MRITVKFYATLAWSALLLAAQADTRQALANTPRKAAEERSSAPPRSLWVWNTAAIRAGDAAQSDFFRFIAAPKGAAKNAITTIYFDGLDAKKLADPAIIPDLRKFLKEAHARHLRVDYLTGDPSWVTPHGQETALKEMDAVLAFNRGGAPSERYDGFQYDVEPYILKAWPSPALRQGMLDLLDRTRAAIKTSGQKVILTAAIPRWYDQEKFAFLDRDIIDRTDEVLIMDYVSKANRLVDDAADELAYAAKTGKKVWIGVETKDLKDTPTSTFFSLGDAAMEGVLAEATPRFSAQKSFAGYAIHHWVSYVALKP